MEEGANLDKTWVFTLYGSHHKIRGVHEKAFKEPYLELSVFGKDLMGSLLDIDIDLGIRRRITELESCYACLGKLCFRKARQCDAWCDRRCSPSSGQRLSKADWQVNLHPSSHCPNSSQKGPAISRVSGPRRSSNSTMNVLSWRDSSFMFDEDGRGRSRTAFC